MATDMARRVLLELRSTQREGDEERPLVLAGGDLAHIGRRPWPTSYTGLTDEQPTINGAALERTPKVVLDIEHDYGHKYYVLKRFTAMPSENLVFAAADVSTALFAFTCAIEQCVGHNYVNAAAWVEHRTTQPGNVQVLLVIPRSDSGQALLQQDEGPWLGYGKSGGSSERLEAALRLVESAFKPERRQEEVRRTKDSWCSPMRPGTPQVDDEGAPDLGPEPATTIV